MKKDNSFKHLKNLVCIIFSFIFIFTAVIVPFYYSIAALTVPKILARVVSDINLETLTKDSPDLKTTLLNLGIDNSQANKYIKNSNSKKLLEIYADEATTILLNIPKDRTIDVPLLKEIVDENLGNFIAIAEEYTKSNISETEIQTDVDKFFQENEYKIEEVIPSIEETRTMVKTLLTSNVINRKMSLTFFTIIVIGIAIILALIYLIKKVHGLLWIGIDFSITSLLLAAIVIFSRSFIINKIALNFTNFETEIIKSAIFICTEKIMLVLYYMIALAITFIISYIVLILIKRKHARKVLNSSNPTDNSDIDQSKITEDSDI